MADSQAVQSLLSEFEVAVEPLDIAGSLANWNLSITGDSKYADEIIALRIKEHKFFSDPDRWARLQMAYEEREGLEPDLRRQVERLYLGALDFQSTAEENERLARLETEAEQIYTNHRATVGGRTVNQNEIYQVLRTSTDEDARREAWEGGKQVGPRVAELVRELARVRNRVARRLGFRDHYHFALTQQEIDEEMLLSLFQRLADLTEQPFARAKEEVDARLADRLGVAPDSVAPWHYADPFFQSAPPVFDADLDSLFVDKEVEQISQRAYHAMGMEVEDVLARSDLYERDGKDQHAFCTRIGRGQDVRILCNLRSNLQWMETQMHELGHAVYDKYLPAELPYFLREVAHTNSTEAIAMLMGRLPHNARWLLETVGAEAGAVNAIAKEMVREQAAGMLIFVRWALVMLHFERALYADPDRSDLNALWWELVECYQRIPCPNGRDAPDWAAKLHVALAPVYYHNYVIGELTASQLQTWLEREAGGLVENPAAGQLLRERVFISGSRYRWDQLVEVATGEPLNPEYYARQFVDAFA